VGHNSSQEADSHSADYKMLI